MRFLSFYFKNGKVAIFSPEHIIFRKECQCKIKILNFCLGYFDKINLNDVFFFKFIMLC